jgi:hypothetical protein
LSLEDQKQEIAGTDFTKDAQVKEMFGCARDHSKEIDLYDKSYEEKMARVRHMKEEGNKQYKEREYEKAAYYFA